jgi:hypothetical protein
MMDEITRIEYAFKFESTGQIEPLGARSPRQVKRQLEGLIGTKAGDITVLARGVVELTGDWVEVGTDPQLHPAIPSWQELGFLLGGYERDQRLANAMPEPTPVDVELPPLPPVKRSPKPAPRPPAT